MGILRSRRPALPPSANTLIGWYSPRSTRPMPPGARARPHARSAARRDPMAARPGGVPLLQVSEAVAVAVLTLDLGWRFGWCTWRRGDAIAHGFKQIPDGQDGVRLLCFRQWLTAKRKEIIDAG